jgi:hypothetical protein
MLLGSAVDYNGSFDQGSNDLNAFSLYGLKGESCRNPVITNATRVPKIQHVVLPELQLWPVRQPSKIMIQSADRNISSHSYDKCRNLLPTLQRGFIPDHKSCKCWTIMCGLSLLVEQTTTMWTVDRKWASYKYSSHSTWKLWLKTTLSVNGVKTANLTVCLSTMPRPFCPPLSLFCSN